jgi:preprotein translocase subunit SecB
LKLTLHGLFEVNDITRLGFDSEGLKKWAEKNGALVLLPFLREAVYSFTQKTGFQPLLIPLVETTAFRVTPPAPRTPDLQVLPTPAASAASALR